MTCKFVIYPLIFFLLQFVFHLVPGGFDCTCVKKLNNKISGTRCTNKYYHLHGFVFLFFVLMQIRVTHVQRLHIFSYFLVARVYFFLGFFFPSLLLFGPLPFSFFSSSDNRSVIVTILSLSDIRLVLLLLWVLRLSLQLWCSYYYYSCYYYCVWFFFIFFFLNTHALVYQSFGFFFSF